MPLPHFFSARPTTALVSLLLAGCTLPKASYKQVDEASPTYRAALIEETQRLQADGKSTKDAAKLAPEKARAAVMEAEKSRRADGVAPLIQVMAGFERPRGCWAYTLTRTRTVDGVATVTVERFDPFEPEARIWTLLSRDGQAPDEKAQSDYREESILKWKKSLDRKSRMADAEYLSRRALTADFEVSAPEGAHVTEYHFGRKNTAILLVGNTGEYRHTFVVDRAHTTLLQRTMQLLSPAAALAHATKIDRFRTTTDYTIIDPALPPFIAKVTAQFRIRMLAQDTGDVTEEAVYSDYRRVKCYDDRFEVKIGPPSVADFLPE